MFNHQVEEIQMTNVVCNLATHQGKVIEALFLSPESKQSATLCSKCLINSHNQCRDQLNGLENIPKQLMELQQISFVMLQEMINQPFKELLSQIQQFLLPISKYQNTPNLTNLNEIGFLLKQFPKQMILQLIDGKKNQIRWLLEKELEQQVIGRQVQRKYYVDNWFEVGGFGIGKSRLQMYLKMRAQYIIIRILIIIRSKGRILLILIRHKINPNDCYIWYQKGESLSRLGKFEEAIRCYEEQNKIDPVNYYGRQKLFEVAASQRKNHYYISESVIWHLTKFCHTSNEWQDLTINQQLRGKKILMYLQNEKRVMKNQNLLHKSNQIQACLLYIERQNKNQMQFFDLALIHLNQYNSHQNSIQQMIK